MTTMQKPRYSTPVESISPYEAAQRQALSAGLFLRLAWRNLWRHRRRTVIVVIYAMGGYVSYPWTPTASVERFNEKTGQWSSVAPLDTARGVLAGATDKYG